MEGFLGWSPGQGSRQEISLGRGKIKASRIPTEISQILVDKPSKTSHLLNFFDWLSKFPNFFV